MTKILNDIVSLKYEIECHNYDKKVEIMISSNYHTIQNYEMLILTYDINRHSYDKVKIWDKNDEIEIDIKEFCHNFDVIS